MSEETGERLAEIAERQALLRTMPELVTQLTVEYLEAANLWLGEYLTQAGGPERWRDMGLGQQTGMLWQAQIDYLIGIVADERAQLTAAQARSREDAEIMRESSERHHRDSVDLVDWSTYACDICNAAGDAESIDKFPHTPDCVVTKLRARADELEGRTDG